MVTYGDRVTAPKEFVKNGEIVLNISPDATGGLKLGNDWIEFKARFGGVARDILVPVDQVVAIYARENGQGMSFPKVSASKETTLHSVHNSEPSRADGSASSLGSSVSSAPAIPSASPPTLQMVFSSD